MGSKNSTWRNRDAKSKATHKYTVICAAATVRQASKHSAQRVASSVYGYDLWCSRIWSRSRSPSSSWSFKCEWWLSTCGCWCIQSIIFANGAKHSAKPDRKAGNSLRRIDNFTPLVRINRIDRSIANRQIVAQFLDCLPHYSRSRMRHKWFSVSAFRTWSLIEVECLAIHNAAWALYMLEIDDDELSWGAKQTA